MTTLPEGFTEDEYQDVDNPEDIHGQLAGHTVVPVHVVHDESVRVAPEFCASVTWTVPLIGSAVPVQLLTRRYKRYKAKLFVNFPGSGGTLYVSAKQDTLMGTNPQGFIMSVAAPPVPSQPAVPASTVVQQNINPYPVNVTLSGFTLTAVTVNGVQVGTTNGTYIVPAGGTIAVTYTVAGTWTWVNANTLVPSIVPLPEYEAMQPLYAVATVAGITISVWDESYGEVAT